jgi:hypothetical protein
MAEGEKVIARVVLNVAGKPKEHVEKSMGLVIENIGKEKDIKVVKKKILKTQKKDELYFSAVAELEISCADASLLMGFCLDYMPSSVEIVEPEGLSFDAMELTGLLNDMLSKLHYVNVSYGEMKSENDLLKQNGEHLLKNIVMISIRDTPKTIEAISGDVGIKPEELLPFVERFVKEGKIEKKDELYKFKKSLY